MTSPIEGHNVTTLTYVGGPVVVPSCECGWVGPDCFEANEALSESIEHRCDSAAAEPEGQQ